MPTKKRIIIPGGITHIMARGIDGKNIFPSDDDREYFLSLFSQALRQSGHLCYAWALMDTHYHLILRCSESPLARMMRVLNGKYARYYNRKYDRNGYLFQDRFKSIMSQDQKYLEELIRYVHLNPLRAGICRTIEELDRYRWCGHSAVMGQASCGFQTIKPVLRRFGRTLSGARIEYRKFINEGIGRHSDDWLIEMVRSSNHGIDRKDRPECWVIGDRDFVVTAIKNYAMHIGLTRSVSEKWTIERLCNAVACSDGLNMEDLLKRSRSVPVSNSKKRFIFLACRAFGFPAVKVAAFLNVSQPAVSYAIPLGEKLVSKKDISKFINLTPG
ncbi:MAG: hypothetical protein GF398_17430 [Chitinivibrionales bacterium]|nr:hypothetical protein [Chitinivibrionales bacterium]